VCPVRGRVLRVGRCPRPTPRRGSFVSRPHGQNQRSVAVVGVGQRAPTGREMEMQVGDDIPLKGREFADQIPPMSNHPRHRYRRSWHRTGPTLSINIWSAIVRTAAARIPRSGTGRCHPACSHSRRRTRRRRHGQPRLRSRHRRMAGTVLVRGGRRDQRCGPALTNVEMPTPCAVAEDERR